MLWTAEVYDRISLLSGLDRHDWNRREVFEHLLVMTKMDLNLLGQVIRSKMLLPTDIITL